MIWLVGDKNLNFHMLTKRLGKRKGKTIENSYCQNS